jgi:hypothetical protein
MGMAMAGNGVGGYNIKTPTARDLQLQMQLQVS